MKRKAVLKSVTKKMPVRGKKLLKIGAKKKLLKEEMENQRRMPTALGIGTAGVA